MNKSRVLGLTLIELLVVIAIVIVIAALTFPILNGAKRKANETHCVSNLRQLGIGLGIYEADFGPDALPVSLLEIPGINSSNPVTLKCHAARGRNGNPPVYRQFWPPPFDSRVSWEEWQTHLSKYGDATILIGDENHTQSPELLGVLSERHTALGLQKGGAVVRRTSIGDPGHREFWHD